MIYLNILSNLFLFAILIALNMMIYLLWKILNMQTNQAKKNENHIKRTHSKIKTNNNENAFGKDKVYELYKNQRGLYEPIKQPSRGIDLKKKGE